MGNSDSRSRNLEETLGNPYKTNGKQWSPSPEFTADGSAKLIASHVICSICLYKLVAWA